MIRPFVPGTMTRDDDGGSVELRPPDKETLEECKCTEVYTAVEIGIGDYYCQGSWGR
jgi:hypothetical protein